MSQKTIEKSITFTVTRALWGIVYNHYYDRLIDYLSNEDAERRAMQEAACVLSVDHAKNKLNWRVFGTCDFGAKAVWGGNQEDGIIHERGMRNDAVTVISPVMSGILVS